MRKKMTSKVMAVALTAAMAMGLVACSNTDNGGAAADNNGVAPETKEDVVEEKTEGETAPVEEEVSPYTVITDASGNPVDLGGISVVLKDWWSNPDDEPKNEYDQAVADYREWAQETYNFTMVQSGDYGWGDCVTEFTEYAQSPDDGNYYLFTVRDDPTIVSAVGNGLCYDLSTLDCLDFSANKYAMNQIADKYLYKGGIYAMSAGVSEPRDGLFVNKKALSDAGLSMDDIYDLQMNGQWDWAHFEEILATLMAKGDVDNDGEIDVWPLSGNNGSFVLDMVFANGGALFGSDANGYTYSVEDPKTVEGLEEAVKLLTEYRMVDPKITAEDGTTTDAPWDYFYEAFKNGEVVFMCTGAYAGYGGNGQIADIENFEIGFVAIPKGPEGELVCGRDNNPVVIPANYDADKAWKLAFAYDVWTEAPAGYEDYNGYISNCRSGIFDERACEETIPLLCSAGHGYVNYAGMIPDLDVNNGFIWSMGPGAVVSELIDSKREYFQSAVDAANAR